MRRITGRAVFSVGTREYRWLDVILGAHLWGAYDELERQTRDGIAWVKQLAKQDEALTESESDDAADAWRYERDLLAADDLQQWLADRQLDMDEWAAYIDRSVLRTRAGSPKVKVAAAEIDQAIYAEAVCAGILAELARRLAGKAAVFDRVDADPGGARCPRTAVREALKRLPASIRRDGLFDVSPAETIERAELIACLGIVFDRFLDDVVAPAALEREVETHRLEWTRLVCDTVPFASEEAAREAALLVREDSFPLADVAAMGKSAVTKSRFVLDDLDPPLKDRLVGARPGDLIAPIESNGSFLVISVVARVEPSTKDRDVRARAADRVVARTIQREIENRVRWHERV